MSRPTTGKIAAGLLLVLAVTAGALAMQWYVRARDTANRCALCTRPVHTATRATVERDGKRESACCIACVLAMRAQVGRPTSEKARLISVADYDTGAEIAPEPAAYVVGPEVKTCSEGPAVKFDETKHPLASHYDRCAPVILAFSSKGRADEFAKQHGGKVATLRDLG